MLTLTRFMDLYVERSESEDRAGELLMMVPVTARSTAVGAAAYDWEPAITLTHCISLGINHGRSFPLGLRPRDDVRERDLIERTTVAFTTDEQLVLGLAIEDTERAISLRHARQLLDRLISQFDCHLGLIAVEQAAPLSEQAFRELTGVRFPLYLWSRQE